MKKVKKWVGILALVFLILQSTVGIINYTQTGAKQGFPSGMERMNSGGGMPPQMNNTDPQDGATEDTSGTVSSTERPDMPQNGKMPNFNSFEQSSGSSSFLRNLENGVVGVMIDGLSLLLAVTWIGLSVLTRRQNKKVTPEV
ncbi:hypothetical protein ABE096_08850 [Robertmurraya massiliosenegalensis]|uniref:hypothetical protein n=1 Tax=Robertmurraya TaxID=2837507 RepID=UPI0039A74746